jgi:transposase
MRGGDDRQSGMFSYVRLDQRVPEDHPARVIGTMVDRALKRMDVELWQLYSAAGRPSIAPERLLRSQLLRVLYSVRSERQSMEQLNYRHSWPVCAALR